MFKDDNFFQKKLLDHFLLYNKIDIESISVLSQKILEENNMLAISLIDVKSGVILSSTSSDKYIVSQDNEELFTIVKKMIKNLENQSIKGIVVTQNNELHFSIPVSLHHERDFYLYFIADRDKTNLIFIRKKIIKIIKKLIEAGSVKD